MLDGEALRGFCVWVTADRGGCEQAGVLADQGATVLHQPPTGDAALPALWATLKGSVDAVTFATADSVARLFMLASYRGQASSLRWALNGQVVAACTGAAYPATRARGIDEPLAVEGTDPAALARAVNGALLSRVVTLEGSAGPVQVRGRLVIAPSGRTIELTPRQRALLDALGSRPGAVLSKAAILRDAWGPGPAQAHAVEVTVARLRQKLAPLGLAVGTARRRGYWLEATRQPAPQP